MKRSVEYVASKEASSVFFTDHVNRHTGWCLLLAALTGVMWLDHRSLSQESRAFTVTLGQTVALQAQAMIAALGILQIATPKLLHSCFLALGRNIAAWLTASGSLLAGIGYALSLRWSYASWLIVLGGIINLAVFANLMKSDSARQINQDNRSIITMISFGMLLMATMALHDSLEARFGIIDLGPADGFTLRTLRLARVAAIALPVLTLLYQGLADESEPRDRIVRMGRLMMLCGTVGMASILVGAGLIFVYLKVLLIIPSIAIFAGVVCGLRLARRHAVPLETWGWLLIALSMAAGLLMGLYAFASPWVRLQFPGEYDDYARRLIRLAHVNAVVLGLVAIFISREIHALNNHWVRIGAPLLIAGSIVMVGIPVLLVVTNLSTAIQSIGPSLVVTAMIICIGSTAAQNAGVSQGGNS